MNFFGHSGLMNLLEGLSFSAVNEAVNNVFNKFSGVLTGAILLTLTVYFIRKILSGANKGKARLR